MGRSVTVREYRAQLSHEVQARVAQWFSEVRWRVPPERWGQELDHLLLRWAEEQVLLPATYVRDLQHWIAAEATRARREGTLGMGRVPGALPHVPVEEPIDHEAPFEFDPLTGDILDNVTGEIVDEDELNEWESYLAKRRERDANGITSENRRELTDQDSSLEPREQNLPPQYNTPRLVPSDPLFPERDNWPELGGIPIRPGTIVPKAMPEAGDPDEAGKSFARGALGVAGFMGGPAGAVASSVDIIEDPLDPVNYIGVIPFGGIAKKGKKAARVGRVGRAGSKVLRKVRYTARRNAHLAGKRHPVTGIPFDKQGHPDFSSVVKKQVAIKYTGSRYRDVVAANAKAGYKATPYGYTWHHHQDRNTMQLVPKQVHEKTGHDGGYTGR